MKPITSFALLSALATLASQGAVTDPVGYVTESIDDGYNLLGLTVHGPVAVAGELDDPQPTANVLTDTGADFSGISGTSSYVVELDGGVVFEVPGTAFNDATDEITVGLPDTTPFNASGYVVRPMKTISDVFGPANEAGLNGGTSATLADTILVPKVGGGFDEYFYSTGGFFGVGWRLTGAGAADQAATGLSYIDGFYVNRKSGGALDLVVEGEVKVTDTSLPLNTGFNLLGTVYPVGVTLGESGLENSLTQGSSATVADTILVPNALGGFDEYFYANGGFFGTGWRLTGAGAADQASVALPSAVYINRKGAPEDALLSVPSTWDLGTL